MPWEAKCTMQLREEFVLRALEKETNMAELCRKYAISRKTGYKWIARFEAGGVAGLEALSHRPHRPLQVSGDVVAAVVAVRQAHSSWGPRKIVAILKREKSVKPVPCARTVARILTRTGMVNYRPRQQRESRIAEIAPHVDVKGPNDLWTVDFKGWWRTKDHSRCEPLTVRDAASRHVLAVRIMMSTDSAAVRSVFEELFNKHGLPKVIQSDNGPPFASWRNPLGLSVLSAWWISLGIQVVRSRPAKPQDNGAHERMHADVSREVEGFAEMDLPRQQRACDRWRHEFNHHRPHEALDMKTPADVYSNSARRYSPKSWRYSSACDLRLVASTGRIKYKSQELFLSSALAGHSVGVEAIGEEVFRVWFADLCLGWIKQEANALAFQWASTERKLA
jgi:putative transposase